MQIPCDTHGTAPSRNHIDGYGNQPLGSGFGRAPHPAIAGQLTHPALRDAQAHGRLSYRDVVNIIGRCLGIQLELNGARLLQRAHLVDQKSDDLAVVVQSLEDAFIVGGREITFLGCP